MSQKGTASVVSEPKGFYFSPRHLDKPEAGYLASEGTARKVGERCMIPHTKTENGSFILVYFTHKRKLLLLPLSTR